MKKIKNNIFFIILVFISSISLYLYSQNNYQNNVQKILSQYQNIILNEYKTVITSLEELADLSFQGFVENDNYIKEAFATLDREKLYNLMQKPYDYLKKIGFTQVHFHSKDNISFLRMHKPDRFGDDLTNIRYSVKLANETKQKVSGLEVGRVLPGYRFVYPIFYKNEHIGSVEFSFGMEKTVKAIEKTYFVHSHFLIEKSLYDTIVFSDYRDYYIKSIENSKFVKLNRQECNYDKNLYIYENNLLNEISSEMDNHKVFTKELKIHNNSLKDTHHSITFLPIKNLEQNEIFYFVFYHKSDELLKLEKDYHKVLLTNFFIILIVFTILWLLMKKKEIIEKSENKFKQLLQNSTDAVHITTLEANVVECSNSFISMLGYTKEEILKLNAKDWSLKFDEDKKHLKDILQNKEAEFQTKFKRKDGSVLDAHVLVKVIQIEEEKYLYASARDITNQKNLENQIVKEKNFINTVINSANAIIAIIDHEGRMFRVNDYTVDFTCYTQEEIASVPYFWSRFLPLDKKEKVIDIIEQAKKGTITKFFKNSWISKNGEERVFEWSNTLVQKQDGTMDYIATIGIDVTQREAILEQILEKKVEFETIFHYAQDGIAIVDLEGNFLKFNKSFQELLEYSKEELLQKNCNDLTALEDKEKNLNAIKQAIIFEHVENFEKDCITKSNKRLTVHCSVSLLPDKKSLLFMIKDETSIKLLEKQSKLASMGTMIGNIAHQWRQPLSIITTSASGLKIQAEFDSNFDKQDIGKYSDLIVQQAEYLSNTIDNFRDFIKEDLSYSPITIDNVLKNTLGLVEATIKNNYIHLVTNIENNLTIEGNINELNQAFINIINNAKDILKEKIPNQNDRYIFITAKQKDKKTIFIEFKDSGGGIPEDIIDRILEPYFTSKHQSVGTGLGLSMVDKIIRERHNGIITVSNEVYEYNNKQYKGANFTIELKRYIV